MFLSVCLPFCLSICLYVYLSVYCLSVSLLSIYWLFVCPAIWLSACLSPFCLSVYPPVCLSIHMSSFCLSLCHSVCLCMSTWLSVYLAVYLLPAAFFLALYICLSIHLSLCLSDYLSTYTLPSSYQYPLNSWKHWGSKISESSVTSKQFTHTFHTPQEVVEKQNKNFRISLYLYHKKLVTDLTLMWSRKFV